MEDNIRRDEVQRWRGKAVRMLGPPLIHVLLLDGMLFGTCRLVPGLDCAKLVLCAISICYSQELAWSHFHKPISSFLPTHANEATPVSFFLLTQSDRRLFFLAVL